MICLKFQMSGNTPTYMFFLTDHLGSVRVVVDENGNVRQVNQYYPYGELIEDANMAEGTSSDNRYLFTGKELVTETGLYDLMARYLATSMGRFTTIDSLAEKYPSVSPYVYCAGDPVNFVDPDGRDAKVTITDSTITISANIYIYGFYASHEVAQEIQTRILSVWQDTWEVSYYEKSINFEVKVFYLDSKPEFFDHSNGMSNYMEVDNKLDGTPGNSSRVINTNEGRWNIYSCLHEFGHIIGLRDRYHTEINDGKPQSVPDGEYVGTMMGEASGFGYVTPDEIQRCVISVCPNGTNGVYYIDKNNRENK